MASMTGGQQMGRGSEFMIASVRGEVLEVALDHVVIEAAGVGYRVNATPATLATLRQGTEARLITAMIVREDSMTLYGFPDGETRDLFLTLLSVSGVGPRLAMAALAVHDAPALRQVLADGNVAALTRVPGIGKRGAERMVLELRDKVGVAATGGALSTNGHAVRSPVVEALVGLGFAAKQAEEATDTVLAANHDATTSSALRSALSLLGKAR
nr:Chain A, Holliday junction ATP-dependent DNA helicase ruvA [Mycobacterium tuberculosis]2ZTC_B Chain B, Holliday junction ATP-dependent DNA helicase ruvA [Mycobacterium tuberculosis]2ZTC_C Chain C, Holliday junction ATP-dependent DNA helicase ruvA [Mycobacterium tuberculosis]2ZTC_D Chain D, Holliday junction ATP-dependent DNA helicase ruvA [Mycobacterium tuberculosis]2ZTD_A Chain A, Holliday junction ATP-dependent DNA helicase ruvA [Mycobacterium tuberculosis]2ZTD_B Chain B, Holliday junctio